MSKAVEWANLRPKGVTGSSFSAEINAQGLCIVTNVASGLGVVLNEQEAKTLALWLMDVYA